mgnify:CR=1 FL=1
MDVLDDLRKAFIGQIVAKRAFCPPALENWGPDLHNLGPDGIVARITDLETGGQDTVRADYLVACDGAGSATTRATRGFSRWVIRLITPPLPSAAAEGA